MGFIITLILVTLSIAGSAAFFSIYGLANIFTGSFLAVVIMASSLEAGKLIAASFVYRYWSTISFMMKSYLISAVLVLMIITSAGVFGFLSAAYQQDTLPLKEMQSKIALFDERKKEIENLKQERITQRARLDTQIDSIPGNHSTNRRKMRETQKEERAQIDIDLRRYALELQTTTTEQHKIKNAVIQQEAHTGPIIFIAKAFDSDIDDAIKWMILLIIFAFDPLAVILTIGSNIAIVQRQKDMGTYKVHKIINDAVEVDIAEYVHHQNEYLHEEPEPSITSPEDIPEEMVEDIPVDNEVITKENPLASSIEQLQSMLSSMNQKPELSPQEIMEKQQIEQLLRRKQVTTRIRSPEKVLEEKVLERQPHPDE
jgi:TolA-binding protein